jgi:hypothetical protein
LLCEVRRRVSIGKGVVVGQLRFVSNKKFPTLFPPILHVTPGSGCGLAFTGGKRRKAERACESGIRKRARDLGKWMDKGERRALGGGKNR